MEKYPLHLKNPELQASEEVQSAVEKQERIEGEKVPNDPKDRIEAYMDRLENIFLNPDEKKRERNLNMLRDKIYDALIIKKENFPESYFELQQRIARERGQAVEEIPADIREQMMNTAIEDQKHSLDAWMDYLTSSDAVYPAWFKYYVWAQIIKLSQFDKERGEFKKRTDSTVAPFPDIYREPLAQMADLYERVKDDNKDSEARKEFDKRFPTLYAELTTKSLAASMENREEIKGEWVKYEHGNNTDAKRLYDSLQGKGTGWCTAGQSTAKTQIENGDFYVYYTNDRKGEPTQPRLAIRMEGEHIGEVRGVLLHQAVEPQLNDILETKLSEFGGEGEKYKKKSEDMKYLTQIEKKINSNESLSKDNLIFLYEVDNKIEGFGYKADPRIKELQGKRNIQEDLLIIFDCEESQVSFGLAGLNDNTRLFVGKVDAQSLSALSKLETRPIIYESFPNKPVSFVDPKDLYLSKRDIKSNGSKEGEFTLNPESYGIDYDKVKVSYLTLSYEEANDNNIKTVSDAIKYILNKYADKYIFPGIEFIRFVNGSFDRKEIERKTILNHSIPDYKNDVSKQEDDKFIAVGSMIRVQGAGIWEIPCLKLDALRYLKLTTRSLSSLWFEENKIMVIEK